MKGIVAVDPAEADLAKLPKSRSAVTTANSRAISRPSLRGWTRISRLPRQPTPVSDPKPNRDNTSLKLADQGCFWVGVQRKKMSYGTIALGQMYVQYMIPAEKRYPYPGDHGARRAAARAAT